MTGHPTCLLYTTDDVLARRVRAYAPFPEVAHIEQAPDLKRALQQHHPALLMFDVRGSDSIGLLESIREDWSDTLVIAFGVSRSDPVFHALDLGVYADQDLDFDGASLESLLKQAADHLMLAEELRILRTSHESAYRVPPPSDSGAKRSESTLPLRRLLQPLRHFDNVEELLQGIIDGIASTAVVLRAGIFACVDEAGIYRLHAGIGCLDDTREMTLTRDDPFVRWLEINAQLISRSSLQFVDQVGDRMLLQRTLDKLGAEMIIPLSGRNQMQGWLFLGRRATGGSFEESDIQDVMMLAEHVSTSLENATLYRQVAQQKAFAETLLHALPTGVVSINSEGRIDWFNDAAESLMNLKRADVMHQPVKILGPKVADKIHHALRGTTKMEDVDEWQDKVSKRFLSLRTVRLANGDRCYGAVAFISDRSREELLNRRQQELDRAKFWTELAASMSHEIRNPMVAIKTFAQLLPERYNDSEFRTEFSSLMSHEVDRLDAIIQQINNFANLPDPQMEIIDIVECIHEGKNQASVRVAPGSTTIQMDIEDGIPVVRGDRRALTDCFAHVLANAMEALKQHQQPEIVLSANMLTSSGDGETVEIVIRDNAGGIDLTILSNIFSPFCTTKPRPMGLGLPIVQRTIADHGGHLAVDTDESGTQVKITLPAVQHMQRVPV
jgi:nitrogen-specific signal transduction histidine kinase